MKKCVDFQNQDAIIKRLINEEIHRMFIICLLNVRLSLGIL